MRKALIATILVCAILTAVTNTTSSILNTALNVGNAQHSTLCPVGRF